MERKILTTQYQGRTFLYPADSMVGECIAEGQGWDRVLVPILELFYRHKKPVIAEVGTNIGGSLLQMEIACPNADFYCFEPVDLFYSIAAKNLEANGWKNVHLEKSMLSDREEEVTLNVNTSTASAAISEYRESIRTLSPVGKQLERTTTLDRCMRGRKLDFLKIDTDGYEPKVIRGATDTISSSNPSLFFEFDPRFLSNAGEDPNELLRMLRDFGYSDYLVLNNFGESLGVEDSPEKIVAMATSTPYYVDLLGVHKSSGLKDKLDGLGREIGMRYATYPSHVRNQGR